jgi:curved DNA-binding protein
MEYKDYYKTLGVERNVFVAELQRAYRKHHPDVRRESNAEQRLREDQEAYGAVPERLIL